MHWVFGSGIGRSKLFNNTEKKKTEKRGSGVEDEDEEEKEKGTVAEKDGIKRKMGNKGEKEKKELTTTGGGQK